MTKNIGISLPDDLYGRLVGAPDKNPNRVIIFSTVDESGFPHHGMLSHYEVVAKNRETIMIVIYSNSKSAQNIRRNLLLTLLFVDEEMSYYVKTVCRELDQKIPEDPNQSVFELTVKQVLDDKSPSAKITSGINYSGTDPGVTSEQRERIFASLRNLASN
jgi:Pyridoxamine 5'-phosphate oxidase